ncbi:MAG TPA: hypothetical protein VF132_12815 [Rudaea sp.]
MEDAVMLTAPHDPADTRAPAPRVKRRPTLRAMVSRHRIASIADSIFATDAGDAHGGLWILWVEKCGRAMLQRDGDVIATLDCHDGALILHEEECPFERADDLLTRLTREVWIDREVRESLELELARWIAHNL